MTCVGRRSGQSVSWLLAALSFFASYLIHISELPPPCFKNWLFPLCPFLLFSLLMITHFNLLPTEKHKGFCSPSPQLCHCFSFLLFSGMQTSVLQLRPMLCTGTIYLLTAFAATLPPVTLPLSYFLPSWQSSIGSMGIVLFFHNLSQVLVQWKLDFALWTSACWERGSRLA